MCNFLKFYNNKNLEILLFHTNTIKNYLSIIIYLLSIINLNIINSFFLFLFLINIPPSSNQKSSQQFFPNLSDAQFR